MHLCEGVVPALCGADFYVNNVALLRFSYLYYWPILGYPNICQQLLGLIRLTYQQSRGGDYSVSVAVEKPLSLEFPTPSSSYLKIVS
jgi:hypothetical protein